MQVAPFNLIERDNRGRVIKLTPVHFVALRNLVNTQQRAYQRRGRA